MMNFRTSDLLMQTVIDQFPYYKAGCYCNRAYIHNLIWMSKYIPSLQEQIMMAVINRYVQEKFLTPTALFTNISLFSLLY